MAGAVLNVHYDPASRAAFVRLRDGRTVRTKRLSHQAVAEYGRAGQLLAIAVSDLDATAAEFLRTADEETLLRVIEQQRTRAGRSRPRPARR